MWVAYFALEPVLMSTLSALYDKIWLILWFSLPFLASLCVFDTLGKKCQEEEVWSYSARAYLSCTGWEALCSQGCWVWPTCSVVSRTPNSIHKNPEWSWLPNYRCGDRDETKKTVLWGTYFKEPLAPPVTKWGQKTMGWKRTISVSFFLTKGRRNYNNKKLSAIKEPLKIANDSFSFLNLLALNIFEMIWHDFFPFFSQWHNSVAWRSQFLKGSSMHGIYTTSS